MLCVTLPDSFSCLTFCLSCEIDAGRLSVDLDTINVASFTLVMQFIDMIIVMVMVMTIIIMGH